MQNRNTSNKVLIQQLQAIAMQTGGSLTSIKKELITQLGASGKLRPAELLKYHDCLLAMLAYPENKELFGLCKAYLNKIKKEVTEIFSGNNTAKQTSFTGTGIEGSLIIGSFSYAIASWLVENFPADTEIESSLADAETVCLFFRQILPRAEYELISAGELSLLQRIKKLKGNNKVTALRWLLEQFDSAGLYEKTKEALFHSLGVYIRWKLNHSIYNRSSLRALNDNPFFQKEIIRQAETKELIDKKIPLPKKLTIEEKQHLINTARATLVFLYRETEPFTYSDINEIACFELERGLTIVLYGMNAERRLSIESYIGYLALKNGIPVAYGGGWIFGTRCQFGINILPAFRGAESSRLLVNLLRVYKQYFGVRCFAIKPYQFGKNNPEALQSGAFWFYYKHGFKPVQGDLQILADEEWKKKVENKNYRSSQATLKKFTASNLTLRLSRKNFPDFDPAKISEAISKFINRHYDGNRALASEKCLKKTKSELDIKHLNRWNIFEKKALQEWSFLSEACLNLASWSSRDKKRFVSLVKAKGSSSELNFIKLLQRHQQLWKDLCTKFLKK